LQRYLKQYINKINDDVKIVRVVGIL